MFRDEGGARVAFSDRDVFYLLDDLKSSQLYNAARNVRIALWKLSYALPDVSEEETERTRRAWPRIWPRRRFSPSPEHPAAFQLISCP